MCRESLIKFFQLILELNQAFKETKDFREFKKRSTWYKMEGPDADRKGALIYKKKNG